MKKLELEELIKKYYKKLEDSIETNDNRETFTKLSDIYKSRNIDVVELDKLDETHLNERLDYLDKVIDIIDKILVIQNKYLKPHELLSEYNPKLTEKYNLDIPNFQITSDITVINFEKHLIPEIKTIKKLKKTIVKKFNKIKKELELETIAENLEYEITDELKELIDDNK